MTITNKIKTSAIFNNVSLVGTSNVVSVSANDLSVILNNMTFVKGASVIASVLQLTAPQLTVKCRDTKEAFNGVVNKLSKVQIYLNTDYANGVEAQLEREAKQKENEAKGIYEKGTNTMPLELSDNNSFYGTFRNQSVLQYRPNTENFPKVSYFLNGVNVEKTDLPNVLPVTKKATNQGTEKEIFWRKLYVKNIVQITINKITYKVIS
jgi:hypothetical protein